MASAGENQNFMGLKAEQPAGFLHGNDRWQPGQRE